MPDIEESILSIERVIALSVKGLIEALQSMYTPRVFISGVRKIHQSAKHSQKSFGKDVR